ncbi:MAG: hypothetical protein EON94_07110, partial [Caulobacteraceae bacterium]
SAVEGLTVANPDAEKIVLPASVVILTGYGESAEQWFETARALNAADYDLWILEGAGQGGSARYTAVTDIGYLPNFDADILALPALIRHLVRPPAGRPVYVIASGAAWLPALAALERRAPVTRLIVTDPQEPTPPRTPPDRQPKARLATGQENWKRPDLARLPRRRRAAAAWAVANPDLRMGGASWGWFSARRRLSQDTLQPLKLATVQTPVTVLSHAPGAVPCPQLPHCLDVPLADSVPYHQAEDKVRDPWFRALLAALQPDHAL